MFSPDCIWVCSFSIVALLNQVMIRSDTGDLVKRLRESFTFVLMGRQCLGDHIDAHTPKRVRLRY